MAKESENFRLNEDKIGHTYNQDANLEKEEPKPEGSYHMYPTYDLIPEYRIYA